MITRELLKATYTHVQAKLASNSINKPLTTSQILWSELTLIEENQAWTRLIMAFTNDVASDPLTILQYFKDFLAWRWARIKENYDLAYPFSYNNLLTRACEALATELAHHEIFFNEDLKLYHRYELLMPGLETNNPSLGMDFYELDKSIEENANQARINLDGLDALEERIKRGEKIYQLVYKAEKVSELRTLEKNIIYINIEKGGLRYIVKGMPKSNFIIKNDLEITGRLTAEKLLNREADILTITTQRGHTPDHVTLEKIAEMREQNFVTAQIKKIQLRDFTIDWEYDRYLKKNRLKPIFIYDCLMDSLIDGVEKHTNAIRATGEAITLDNKQRNRVRYHSQQALELHNAIGQMHESKATSPSVGAALERFSNNLLSAGVNAGMGGTDRGAAENAYVAIAELDSYLTTLSPADYQKLLACSHLSGKEYTFKHTWYALYYYFIHNTQQQLAEEKYNEIMEYLGPGFLKGLHCVELYGDNIKKIIKHNKDLLFAMVPIHLDSSQYENVEKKYSELIKRTAHKLRRAINNNTLKHYNHDEISHFPQQIQQDLLTPIKVSLRTLCRNMAATPVGFCELINDLLPASQSKVLEIHLKRRFLQEIIPSIEILVYVVKNVKNNDATKLILTILGSDFLKNIVTKLADLEKLQAILVADVYTLLTTELLGAETVQNLLNQATPEPMQVDPIEDNPPLVQSILAYASARLFKPARKLPDSADDENQTTHKRVHTAGP